MAQCTCEKCHSTMDEKNFYTYKDGRKTEQCKRCLTMHIDNFNPDTYLWLMEKMDVPYIPSKWQTLLERAFAKNPNLNGASVFGKYLSSMKIKPWNELGWADTERLQEEARVKEEELKKQNAIRDEMLKKDFDEGLITESEYKTLTSAEFQNNAAMAAPPQDVVGANNYYREENYLREDELVDFGAELTKEDKLAMALKWGRLYKPSEWVELEKSYKEMMDSFDIQDADTIHSLKLLCKTNLKANQAIDTGDVDGYQKLARVSGDLRKSMKLTAAQNKEEKARDFDATGLIVQFAEKHGGRIDRYDFSIPLDKADEALMDIKKYMKNLIYDDTNLAQQIETYLRTLENSRIQKENERLAKEQGLDFIPIEDKDVTNFNDFVYDEQEIDKELLQKED